MTGRVAADRRIDFRGEIENPLMPGGYSLECWIRQDRQGGDMALQAMRLLKFVVYGTTAGHGLVAVRARLDVRLEGEA